MPEWPGVADTAAVTCEDPDAQAGNGLYEIGEHLAQFAATSGPKPTLIWSRHATFALIGAGDIQSDRCSAVGSM
jgi:hypothetical protein